MRNPARPSIVLSGLDKLPDEALSQLIQDWLSYNLWANQRLDELVEERMRRQRQKGLQ